MRQDQSNVRQKCGSRSTRLIFCRIEFDTAEVERMKRALGTLCLAINQSSLTAARSLITKAATPTTNIGG